MAPHQGQSVPTESGRMNAFILPVGGRGQGNTVSLPASQAATTVLTGVLKARTEKAEVKSKRGGRGAEAQVDRSPGGPKSGRSKKLQVDRSPGGARSSGLSEEDRGPLVQRQEGLSAKDERGCLKRHERRGMSVKDGGLSVKDERG
jgi:hypothetical protein